MRSKWLDWQPTTEILEQVRPTEPAKPAKIKAAVLAGSQSIAAVVPAHLTLTESTALLPRQRQTPFGDLVSRWLRECCVAVACCASSTTALHRSFSVWANVNLDTILEFMLSQDLQQRGFTPDESAMIQGLVLAADFQAVLQHEQSVTSLPAYTKPAFKQGANSMSMIVRSKPTEFQLPDEGLHLAVLADVVDLGEEETEHGLWDRVQFTWLLQQRRTDGKPIAVRQKPHTKSMHEKSNLRRDIKVILGIDPGNSFDLEELLGLNAILEIKHKTCEGKTYGNIVGIRRPGNGDSVLEIPEDFKRANGVNGKTLRRKRAPLNAPGVAGGDDDVGF